MLVAAMGLPPLAHRDDARRGVQAAMSIREGLERMGVECSVGVATGRVYCGEVGKRPTFASTPSSVRGVNLAARLMQAAKDNHEVLCDEETVRASRAAFSTRLLLLDGSRTSKGSCPSSDRSKRFDLPRDSAHHGPSSRAGDVACQAGGTPRRPGRGDRPRR